VTQSRNKTHAYKEGGVERRIHEVKEEKTKLLKHDKSGVGVQKKSKLEGLNENHLPLPLRIKSGVTLKQKRKIGRGWVCPGRKRGSN